MITLDNILRITYFTSPIRIIFYINNGYCIRKVVWPHWVNIFHVWGVRCNLGHEASSLLSFTSEQNLMKEWEQKWFAWYKIRLCALVYIQLGSWKHICGAVEQCSKEMTAGMSLRNFEKWSNFVCIYHHLFVPRVWIVMHKSIWALFII